MSGITVATLKPRKSVCGLPHGLVPHERGVDKMSSQGSHIFTMESNILKTISYKRPGMCVVTAHHQVRCKLWRQVKTIYGVISILNKF